MISVIIPTLNSEADLAHALASLVPGAADGVVKEVIIVDGGSTDHTEQVADAAGCVWLTRNGARSERMAFGAENAQRGHWLLFMSAETVLEGGWHHEVQNFVDRVERAGSANKSAAVFKLRFDSFGLGARLSEFFALLRAQFLSMPYGNQGLLITRQYYHELGGHRPLPELEDLDLVRRIGRRRLVFLRSGAVCAETSADPGIGIVASLRKSVARFLVGALRVPPRLMLKLHG